MNKKASEYRSEDSRSDITPGSRGGVSLRNLRTFSSLKNRSYRFYFIGMIGDWASMGVQRMTNSLLIYRLTGSAVLLGTMAIANSLPIILFSAFGGVIADRVPKKYVMLIGLGSQAVVNLVIVLALTSGYMGPQNAGSWWVLIATSFLQGSIMAFMGPSQRAVIPEIVPRAQVTNAVALNTMGMNVLQLLAPAAAGFIIAAFGFPAVFSLMTGLYLMGVIFITFIPLTGRAAAMTGSPLANIKEGFGYLRRETIIPFILVWSFFGMGSGMTFTRLMPIFADDILKVGAEGMGLWLSVAGAGALIGSLTIASLTPRRRGFIHVSSSMFHALATVAFTFNRSWYPSLGLMCCYGLGNASGMTMTQALLQDYSAAEYRGRVFGIHSIGQGLTGMVAFSISLLATAVGAPRAVATYSTAVFFLGLMMLVFSSRYRRLA